MLTIAYNNNILSFLIGFVFGLMDLFWLLLVWMVLFLFRRIVFITNILIQFSLVMIRKLLIEFSVV